MINETKMRIPKKYQPMIKEIHRESDGVWVTLNDGFKSTNTDSHTIHETNQADAMEQIRYTIVEWDDDPEIEKTKQQIIDAAPEGAVKQVTCLGGLYNIILNKGYIFKLTGKDIGLYAYKICPPEEREIFQWGKHVQLWEGIAEELEKMDDTRLFYSEKVKEKLQRALNGGYAVSGNCFACDFARRNDNALCQSCPLTDMRSCSTGSPFSWFGSFLSHNNKPAAVATALDISRKEPKNGVWVRDIDDNIYLYFGGKNND